MYMGKVACTIPTPTPARSFAAAQVPQFSATDSTVTETDKSANVQGNVDQMTLTGEYKPRNVECNLAAKSVGSEWQSDLTDKLTDGL